MTQETVDELVNKHPTPQQVENGSLLFGPKLQVFSSYYSNINEQLIHRAALMTKGSAGLWY